MKITPKKIILIAIAAFLAELVLVTHREYKIYRAQMANIDQDHKLDMKAIERAYQIIQERMEYGPYVMQGWAAIQQDYYNEIEIQTLELQLKK